MLDTVYVHIRHMNFWYGEYGICDKSCNDEITIYSDAYKTQILGYFEITTHKSLEYLYHCELTDQEDYDYKKKIEKFLKGNSQVIYNYIYPRDDDDLLDQVNHFAPLNSNNHKPIYIDMWTKLSDELNIEEIKKSVKILVKEFLHKSVSNIEFLDIPTYEETKNSYDEDFHI
jgi:hypothetical protein